MQPFFICRGATERLRIIVEFFASISVYGNLGAQKVSYILTFYWMFDHIVSAPA